MSYTSRLATHRNARDIADAAMSANRGERLLKRCRALLAEIDPDQPPVSAKAREFHWQYRALRERVYYYARRLDRCRDREHGADREIRKLEDAIERSLRYFHDVLSTRPEDEGA